MIEMRDCLVRSTENFALVAAIIYLSWLVDRFNYMQDLVGQNWELVL